MSFTFFGQRGGLVLDIKEPAGYSDQPKVLDALAVNTKTALQQYESKYPFVFRLEMGSKAICTVFEDRAIVKDGLPIDGVFPTTANHEKFVWAMEFLEYLLEDYRSMTALSNHLAVHRKKLDLSGKETPPPVLRVRPPFEFYKSEGTMPGQVAKDLAHQARAYAFEQTWISSLLVQWKSIYERFRLQHSFPVLRETSDGAHEMYRALQEEYPCPASTQVETEKVASRPMAVQRWDLEALASDLLSDGTEKSLVQTYNNRFQSFATQWNRLLIQWPVTPTSGPVETLLAYTSSNAKIIGNAHRQGKKLVKSSNDAESILYRLVRDEILTKDDAVVLPLNGFKGGESGDRYRDDLLRFLGGHKDFPLSLMSMLLQRWQTDCLERAVHVLGYVEKSMKAWVEAHGNDPGKQGIHL